MTLFCRLAAESMGNPLGTVSGAKAMRQAVDATLEGKTLEEYAKTHKELQAALDTWKA